jgi:hypothetical protein
MARMHVKPRKPRTETFTLSGYAQHRRTPGWELYRVPTLRDGRYLDASEARATFADQPWAAEARYLTSARGVHVFEIPPGSKEKR